MRRLPEPPPPPEITHEIADLHAIVTECPFISDGAAVPVD